MKIVHNGEEVFCSRYIGCSLWRDNFICGNFNDQEGLLILGDNVRIMDNVRIICSGTVTLEDNVTLHNHVSIVGSGDCIIKKDSWIGQHTHLDCKGDLEIGEECCIGFNCHIWSHVLRAPRLKHVSFEKIAKTIIGDRVWLMGGLITINPGIILADDCVIFSNSVVTQSTEKNKVYGGIPARVIPGYSQYIKQSERT